MPPSTEVKDPTHWLKLFCEHLLDHTEISKEQLARPLKLLNQVDRRIGQLAVLKGYMSARDVYRTLADGIERNQPFGEVAVRQGLIDEQKVSELLGLQGSPLLLFIECLSILEVVAEPELARHVGSFLAAHRLAGAPEQPRIAAPAERATRTSDVLSIGDLQGREQRLWETLRKVKGLATLPTVVDRILRMLDDPEVKTDKLVKAIQVDPALSAQLLRVANSAFFSRRTKVSSIDRVIITLGMGGIRQFVMASAVLEKFQGAKIEAAKQIWKHSILAGNWAQALARARGLRLPEQEVFVAGMLHDAGRLVIIQYFPDVKQAVAELCASGMVRVQAERETVGVTHADIGAYLFNFWQFPETLIESSRHHHDPPAMIGPSELGPIPRLVNAACRIARTLRADALEESLAELDDEFRDCHEVTGEMLLDLFPEVLRESEQTDWLR